MVLDAGADPNGFPEDGPIYRWWPFRIALPFLRRRALRRREPSDLVDNFALAPGASPLHVACLKGNLGAVQLLIKRGARLDSTNSGSPNLKMTPLMYAAMRGHASIVEELLKHVSPPLTAASFLAMRDRRGKTAMDYATLRGQGEDLLQLLRHT